MLILASNSPRRKEILNKYQIEFEIIPSSVDEKLVDEKDPERLVSKLAMLKTEQIANQYPNRLVLGADTIVFFNGVEFGKPINDEDAYQMLKKLSGNTHQVYTGVVLIKQSEKFIKNYVVKSDVKLKKLTDKEILEYIKTKEPFDKAGSYAIQGIGASFIEFFQGSYENIVGLPYNHLLKTEFYKLPKSIKNDLIKDENNV